MQINSIIVKEKKKYFFSFAYATKASFIPHLNAIIIANPHAKGPRNI